MKTICIRPLQQYLNKPTLIGWLIQVNFSWTLSKPKKLFFSLYLDFKVKIWKKVKIQMAPKKTAAAPAAKPAAKPAAQAATKETARPAAAKPAVASANLGIWLLIF